MRLLWLPLLVCCPLSAQAEFFGSVGASIAAHENSGNALNTDDVDDEPPTHEALSLSGSFGNLLDSGIEFGVQGHIARTNNKDTYNGEEADDAVKGYRQFLGHAGYHTGDFYVGIHSGFAMARYTEKEEDQNATLSLNGAGIGWANDTFGIGLSKSKMNYYSADDEEQLHDADFLNVNLSSKLSDNLVMRLHMTDGEGTLDYLDSSAGPVDVEGKGISFSYLGELGERSIEYTLGYEEHTATEVRTTDGRVDKLNHTRLFVGVTIPLGKVRQPESSRLAIPQNLALIQSTVPLVD